MLRQHLFAAEFQSTLLQWDVNNTQVALFGQGSEGRGQNYVTEGRRKGGKEAKRQGRKEAWRRGGKETRKEASRQGGTDARRHGGKNAKS